MNKDFYNELPGCVCEIIDSYIEKYGKEVWFEDAWEEYRKHVLKSNMDNMRMPGYVFNEYIREANKGTYQSLGIEKESK